MHPDCFEIFAAFWKPHSKGKALKNLQKYKITLVL